MVLDAQVAETPAGNPFAPDTPELEIPFAPVVVWVIAVKAVLIHVFEVLPTVAVLAAVTVTTVGGGNIALHPKGV
jgi:hypothetical protein